MKLRPLMKGMGEAVAKRTVFRGNETWEQVGDRVALGNSLLHPTGEDDRPHLARHIKAGTILMSGRHLQHGDADQAKRNLEVFTNCSTSATSFALFWLLLNGSGVGRSYDDALMKIDWTQLPVVRLAMSEKHADYEPTDGFVTAESARGEHYDVWYTVPDSREGWAQAVSLLETMAYERRRDEVVVIDFSDVRPKGSPINGMQKRPASGPVPLMHAIRKLLAVRDTDWAPWKQTMYVDHFLAECVLVGGARRAARIAVKYWKDADILDFIRIKNDDLEAYFDGDFIGNDKYQPNDSEKALYGELAKAVLGHVYQYIVNPCGEIVLFILGGYCVIADVVPYHADTIEQATWAFRLATRALMRTNLMPAFYWREVQRTNRIGVGMTGIHEFAWKFFGYGFLDLIDEEKSKDFWMTLSMFKGVVMDEAAYYAGELGVKVPHTNTTLKPAGTTSKLYGLTEAAHLPVREEYLRWVQYRKDAPEFEAVKALGYPTKELKNYEGTVVVGFPTQPEICKLGLGEKLILASEATPEQQFQWLRLLEKYWICGVNPDGAAMEEFGNQVSYTLKYDPKVVTFDGFCKVLLEQVPTVRTVSVLPEIDVADSVYEYLPEEPISKPQFMKLLMQITDEGFVESIDMETLACSTGACPL